MLISVLKRKVKSKKTTKTISKKYPLQRDVKPQAHLPKKLSKLNNPLTWKLDLK